MKFFHRHKIGAAILLILCVILGHYSVVARDSSRKRHLEMEEFEVKRFVPSEPPPPSLKRLVSTGTNLTQSPDPSLLL